MEKVPETAIEEDQETSNDMYDMYSLYRKYEEFDMKEFGMADELVVEINVANPEFPFGVASVSHQVESPDPEDEQMGAVKSTGLYQPRDPQWCSYWDRELLLKNREGKGLKQLIELTVKRYEGLNNRLFEKFGSVTFSSGVTYQGPFDEQRQATGVGRVIFPDGTIFDGQVQDGEVGNRGIYHWSDGSVYEGNLHQGMRHGHGRFFDAASRSFYSGNWHYAHMHDYGKLVFYGEEKNFYQGSWNTGIQWGHGIRQWSSGNFYEGQWARGLPHGRGSKFWLAHRVHYCGEFEEGLPHGYGLIVWLSRQAFALSAVNQKYFFGTFQNGFINGYGIFTDKDGCVYKGYWKEGKKHGKFTVTFLSGVSVQCFFVEDVIHDPMKKFLLKETKQTFFLVPLPGPSIRQIDYAPRYNTEVNAIAMPGIVFFLSEKFGFSDAEVGDEITGISSILTSYLEPLTDVYSVYSRLMVETSCDNVYVMRAFQFWQFLVDVVIDKGRGGADVQQGLYHLTVAIEDCFYGDRKRDIFCHPFQPLKPSEFFDRVAVAAYLVEFQKQNGSVWREMALMQNSGQSQTMPQEWPFKKNWDVAGRPLKKLTETRIFELSGSFKSCLFDDPRKCPVVFRYISRLHRLFRYIYEFYGGQQELMPEALSIDALVTCLKDVHIAGTVGLPYVELLRVIEDNYPEIREGATSFNLKVPITLLEFTELIFQIALAYQGDLQSVQKIKPLHGRKPSAFKGKIAEAVDSSVLAAQKNPGMLSGDAADILDYDPNFFAMLRGEMAVGMNMSSGDTTVEANGPEVLIKSSRPALSVTGKYKGEPKSREEEAVGQSLTIHPPNDPTDYEFLDCSLPSRSNFLGFTLADGTEEAPGSGCLSPSSTACPVGLRGPDFIPPKRKPPPTRSPSQGPWHPTLNDMPSLDTYPILAEPIYTVIPLLPPPTLGAWEEQIVSFLEQVFFPNIILFKRTNDLLIQHGHLRPLGDRDVEDSLLSDCVTEAIFDGDIDNKSNLL